MATALYDWRKWSGVAGLLCITLAYFVPVTIANTDLTDGGYCLFMDEEITYGGAQRILHAPDKKTFKRSVSDGDDHRYGRIVWYSSALVSWIPERVYGEQGQIIATRMWYATALWLSYLILVLTFLPGWLFRNAALAALIVLPSTPYYASMPKPEPLQLLFLALFLRYGVAARFCFGWHWVFLGVAFGTKISTAPVGAPFLLAACAAEVLVERPGSSGLARLANWRYWVGLLTTMASFAVGWGLAVPMLFEGTSALRKWWAAILANLGHGHDDDSVTVWTWLDLIHKHWTMLPGWAMVALAALTTILAGVMTVRLARKRQFGSEYLGLVVWLVGMALLLPIMLKVKRLWPIYLHAAAALFCISAFALSDGCIRTYLHGWGKRVAQVLVVLISFVAMFYQYPQVEVQYQRLATRTQEPRHQARLREYQLLGVLFDDLSGKLERPVRVGYDPVLYLHTTNPKLELYRYYGGFLDWKNKYDLIVVDKNSGYWLPNPRVSVPGSAAIENKEKSLKEYLKHVRGSGSDELVEPIYVPIEFPCENILVLMREDIVASAERQLGP